MKGNFGVYTGNKPKKIASTVSKWFSDGQLLNSMSERAKSLGVCHAEATKLISKDIGEMVMKLSSNH